MDGSGHDGSFGYGGSCFPKDVSALNAKMNDLNLKSYIINACLRRNIELDRPERLGASSWKSNFRKLRRSILL